MLRLTSFGMRLVPRYIVFKSSLRWVFKKWKAFNSGVRADKPACGDVTTSSEACVSWSVEFRNSDSRAFSDAANTTRKQSRGSLFSYS